MLATNTDREILSDVEYQVAEFDIHPDEAAENVAGERGMDYFDVLDAVSRAKVERGH